MTRYGDLAEHSMLGLTLWSLIRSRCLVRDECYRLPNGYARMSDQPSAAKIARRMQYQSLRRGARCDPRLKLISDHCRIIPPSIIRT